MAKVVPGQPYDRSALILFGSETGNSEEVAQCLGDVVERLRFASKVCEMDAVELQPQNALHKATVIIFVISTTGLGDIPRNARKFWRNLLRKRLPPNCLSRVSFTTFGLGDSSYVQYAYPPSLSAACFAKQCGAFNWAARKLHKRLEQLAAKEIYPRGEADEQHHEGIDGTYLSWSADFGKRLLSLYPLPDGVEPIPPHVLLPPKYILQLVEEENLKDSSEYLEPEIKDSDPESGSLLGTDAAEGAAIQKTIALASASGKTTLSKSLQSPTTPPRSQPQSSVLATMTSPVSISISVPTLDHPLSSISTTLNSTPASSNLTPISPTSLQSSLAEPLRTGLKESVASVWSNPVAGLSTSTPALHQPSTIVKGKITNSVNLDANLLDRDPPVNQKVQLPGAQGPRVELLHTERMTADNHWQDVRQLTFRLPANAGRPMPGDILRVHPNNTPDAVAELICLNDWEAMAETKTVFKAAGSSFPDNMLLSPIRGLHPVNQTTLRELLTHNLDITAIPTRRFFGKISEWTNDPLHKTRLLDFANPARTEEYLDYAVRSRRSILEVLGDFPSVKIPWTYAADAFPFMQGRQYSICSGGDLTNDTQDPGFYHVQILVAIVKYQTVLQKIRRGLCTQYIESLEVGELAGVSFERGTAGIGSDPRRPAILIGAGTGIAPLRSLILERACTRLENEADRAKTVLFFGGRNQGADYFYQEEWKANRALLTVFPAFSRDQREKYYVQDALRAEGKLVWEMVEGGASVWLCGSSGGMPRRVRAALLGILGFHGRMSREEAEKLLAEMVKNRLFTQETW
ncbi:hypothetical protein HYALB_00006213 [Hymenoscyphus albidus]|uniref:NADPH-dependent FMN and FAD-containing oxidoreductase n=1 Tax=Hymenoscyphus albidus TaxID=595503 RepID=A0A9N9M4M0_9HELO|nr:hypothetical protein HYALB_00006213 [Hymenoscyphus albidus]